MVMKRERGLKVVSQHGSLAFGLSAVHHSLSHSLPYSVSLSPSLNNALNMWGWARIVSSASWLYVLRVRTTGRTLGRVVKFPSSFRISSPLEPDLQSRVFLSYQVLSVTYLKSS